MKKKTPLQSLTEKLSAAGINRYQIALIRELIRYEIDAVKKAYQLRNRKFNDASQRVYRKHGRYEWFAKTDKEKKRNKKVMSEITKIEKRLMPERYPLSSGKKRSPANKIV